MVFGDRFNFIQFQHSRDLHLMDNRQLCLPSLSSHTHVLHLPFTCLMLCFTDPPLKSTELNHRSLGGTPTLPYLGLPWLPWLPPTLQVELPRFEPPEDNHSQQSKQDGKHIPIWGTTQPPRRTHGILAFTFVNNAALRALPFSCIFIT